MCKNLTFTLGNKHFLEKTPFRVHENAFFLNEAVLPPRSLDFSLVPFGFENNLAKFSGAEQLWQNTDIPKEGERPLYSHLHVSVLLEICVCGFPSMLLGRLSPAVQMVLLLSICLLLFVTLGPSPSGHV